MECKKCKRPLPEGSKHKYCENCRGNLAQGVKTIGKTLKSIYPVVVAAVPVVIAAIAAISKPKETKKSKDFTR